MSTSGACGWRSSRSGRTALIETVRGSGYRLAAPAAALTTDSVRR